MTFTEDWFCEKSQDALAGLARSVLHLPGDVVEVGCWEGRSTIALAHAVAPAAVHAVDTWEGSPGEISATLAAAPGRDVYRTFIENVDGLNVVPHREDWRSYFRRIRVPIRFLHIDATHTYDEVRANIEAALPLMVPGGVICGDDAHHPPVREAVWDVLGNAWLTATLWHWRVP